MSNVLIPVGDLVKTWASPEVPYSIGDVAEFEFGKYMFVKFATAASRGNLMYRSTTLNNVTTTYSYNCAAGWAVASTVTINYYGWIQVWGKLTYNGTTAFDALLTTGLGAGPGSLGAMLKASPTSAGKVLTVSVAPASVTLTGDEVGYLLEAIGSTSSGASVFATIGR